MYPQIAGHPYICQDKASSFKKIPLDALLNAQINLSHLQHTTHQHI